VIEAARYYAAAGVPVFPLAPHRKLPLFPSAHPEGDPARGVCRGACGRVGHGVHDATTDPMLVTEWWAREPRANIGISTGATGLLVLDVDGDPGADTILTLQKRYGRLPDTLWQRTGSGWQAIFLNPGKLGLSAGKLGRGLDTRAVGGYICAPPSVHPTGARYVWWNPGAPIAPPPRWMIRLLQPPRRSLRPRGVIALTDRYTRTALEREAERVSSARAGERNTTLNLATYSLARLIGPQLSEELVRSEMLRAASACGLDDREAQNTITSALRARAANGSRSVKP
jgi:hypothetical protein